MWKDLSMTERSDLMKMFLQSGVRSLGQMQRLYDDYEVEKNKKANGGNLFEEGGSEDGTMLVDMSRVGMGAETKPNYFIDNTGNLLDEVVITGKDRSRGIFDDYITDPSVSSHRLEAEIARDNRAYNNLINQSEIHPLTGAVMNRPLETVSPEFDLLTLRSLVKEPIKDVVRKATSLRETKQPEFMDFESKLDWSPEGWFGKYRPGGKYDNFDVKRLKSHLPEYYRIEKEAKANGTWMKDEDGNLMHIDPREWVMRQSKDYKKANLTGVKHFSGMNEKRAMNYDYNGDAWTDLEKSISASWKQSAETLDGKPGYILQVDYPKSAKVFNYDAKGRNWWRLPFDGKYIETNRLVDAAKEKGFDVTKISNVIEGNNEKVTDYVIHKGTPRKSILGNNGDFNLSNKNIYRSLLPFTIGGSVYFKEK